MPEEEVQAPAVSQKYNFMFGGYKYNRCFWEIVILARKIVVYASAILLQMVSKNIAILVTAIIISGFIFLQLKVKPYSKGQLNRLEVLSLLVPFVILVVALFYSIDKTLV